MLAELGSLPLTELPLRPPLCVAPDAPLRDVVAAMREQRRGAAVVVDRGTLAGIFTERDLLRRVDHRDLAWLDQSVSSVMTTRPRVIRETDTLAEALHRMDEGRVRHLPVLRGREPIALLSIRHVLSYLANRFPAEFINLPPDPDHEARAPWGG